MPMGIIGIMGWYVFNGSLKLGVRISLCLCVSVVKKGCAEMVSKDSESNDKTEKHYA